MTLICILQGKLSMQPDKWPSSARPPGTTPAAVVCGCLAALLRLCTHCIQVSLTNAIAWAASPAQPLSSCRWTSAARSEPIRARTQMPTCLRSPAGQRQGAQAVQAHLQQGQQVLLIEHPMREQAGQRLCAHAAYGGAGTPWAPDQAGQQHVLRQVRCEAWWQARGWRVPAQPRALLSQAAWPATRSECMTLQEQAGAQARLAGCVWALVAQCGDPAIQDAEHAHLATDSAYPGCAARRLPRDAAAASLSMACSSATASALSLHSHINRWWRTAS